MNIKPDYYIQNMEEFLHKLQDEISFLVPPLDQNYPDITGLDNYICELNSFYYRSFHERFFPIYKNEIRQEVANLLKLSKKEDLIKQYVLATIKRYVKLYNQVKNISNILSNLRSDSSQQVFSLSRIQDKANLELFYSIRRLRNSSIQLNSFINSINTILNDKTFLAKRTVLPEFSLILEIFSCQDPNDQLILENINNFLVYIHDLKNLLIRLQGSKNCSQQLIDEIFAIIDKPLTSFFGSTSDPLNIFIRTNLSRKFIIYRELISVNTTEDYSRANKAAQEFAKWLDDLLIVIEKAIHYLTTGQKQLLANINRLLILPEGFWEHLNNAVLNLSKNIEPLVNELSNSEAFIYENVSNKSLEIIRNSLPLFNQAVKEENITGTGTLYSFIYQINMELSLLQVKIEFFNQNYKYSAKILENYYSLIQAVDAHFELMENIRSDLQRLLAPRNISRTWKDIRIRIDHIPLHKGKLFPVNYQYLLDKYAVETRITKQDNNLILHEEGDIFIIKVEDKTEEEIPYIIISQRG